MATDARWTIAELAELVGQALAVDYSGQRNGRVREVPDLRTIRWYSTIGLLDRPAAMRGRTALYGLRHLRQVVAVKRLQADGRSIAQVQTALLGADDPTLADLAQLPAGLVGPVDVEAAPATEPDRGRFWAAAAPATPAPISPPAPIWLPAKEEPVLVPTIVLGGGVRLLLDGATRLPDAADLDAISKAAAGLLDVLRDRGLVAQPDAVTRSGTGEN